MSSETARVPRTGGVDPLAPRPAGVLADDRRRQEAGAGLRPVRVDTVEVAIPLAPPPDVLEAVAAAARCAQDLAARSRELHFEKDAASGRIIVEVRDAAGQVLRTIPPSSALEMIASDRGWE